MQRPFVMTETEEIQYETIGNAVAAVPAGWDDPARGKRGVIFVKIAVAGTGYVGLSLAVLLSQHNDVTAVDIVPEKVEKINAWISPILDGTLFRYQMWHTGAASSI